MKRIVFIINSIENQRCVKRVEEFISNGYQVDVYAFERRIAMSNKQPPFPFSLLGSIKNGSSFFRRLPVLYKAINRVVKKYKKDDVVFYLFKIDLTLVYKICRTNHPYIYEESDLTHTYFANHHLVRLMELVDRRIIRGSLQTILTSEGFVRYHFGKQKPNNVTVIPNRLNPKILQFPIEKKKNLYRGNCE